MRADILVSLVVISLAGSASSELAQSPPRLGGEKLTFEVSFLNIPVVTAHLQVTEEPPSSEGPIYHLTVTGKSTPFYSLLYPIDNRYDSYFTWPAAHTTSYCRTIREPGVELQRTIYYRHGQAFSGGEDPWSVPWGIRDLFAAFYALRSQPLDDGQMIESFLDLDGQIWTSRSTVLGRETVQTKLGSHWAVKVEVRFELISQDVPQRKESDVMTNNLVREKTKLTLWLSADHRHVPLKTEYRMSPFSLKAVLATMQ